MPRKILRKAINRLRRRGKPVPRRIKRAIKKARKIRKAKIKKLLKKAKKKNLKPAKPMKIGKGELGLKFTYNGVTRRTIAGKAHRRLGLFVVTNTGWKNWDITTVRGLNVKVNVNVHDVGGGRKVGYMDVYVRYNPHIYKTVAGCCGNPQGQWISRTGVVGPLSRVGPTWAVKNKRESLFNKFHRIPKAKLRVRPVPVKRKNVLKCTKDLKRVKFANARERAQFIRACAIDLGQGIRPKESKRVVAVEHIKPVKKIIKHHLPKAMPPKALIKLVPKPKPKPKPKPVVRRPVVRRPAPRKVVAKPKRVRAPRRRRCRRRGTRITIYAGSCGGRGRLHRYRRLADRVSDLLRSI